MEVTITINTSEGSIGFGWECDDINNDNIVDYISEGIGDSFWEKYFEFENVVERAKKDCPIQRDDYGDEKDYTEAITNWMNAFFKLKLAPITIHYDVDEKSEEPNLDYDFEALFLDHISDITAYKLLHDWKHD